MIRLIRLFCVQCKPGAQRHPIVLVCIQRRQRKSWAHERDLQHLLVKGRYGIVSDQCFEPIANELPRHEHKNVALSGFDHFSKPADLIIERPPNDEIDSTIFRESRNHWVFL